MPTATSWRLSRTSKTVSPLRALESFTDRTVDDAFQVLSGTFTEAEPKDLSEDIDDDEVAEDYGYYSDSDLEDDIDHAARCANPLGTYSERRERPQQGKVIKVQDIAFITCVFPQISQCHHPHNNFAGSRLFYFTYTPVISTSRLTVPRRTASPGR